jgi:hypothetical protein
MGCWAISEFPNLPEHLFASAFVDFGVITADCELSRSPSPTPPHHRHGGGLESKEAERLQPAHSVMHADTPSWYAFISS